MTAKSGLDESSRTKKKTAGEDADTAWRWVVVLGSHLSHQLLWGMFRSTGVLLVEWKDNFDAGAAEISAVASAMSASLLVTAPIAGFLCKRYGCRMVTILGGFLAAVGILAGSQAQNILHLCISVGGITGMGLSLAYTASSVIYGHYFDKGFALANGIVCAGTGVGVMIIPPLVQILIDLYDWRGAMMIMSVVVANICACGAVFRPGIANKNVQSKLAKSNSLTNSELTKLSSEQMTQSTTPNGIQLRTSPNGNSEYVQISNTRASDDTTEDHGQQQNVCKSILIRLFKVIGLHLFWKSRRFFVLCFTQMLVGLSFSGVMVHIVNHIAQVCKERTSVEVSLILSVIGIGSLVARAGHGVLVDKNCMTPMFGYNFGIVVGSIVILLCPVITSYEWFAAFGVVFGICIGLNMSLVRVLVREFLGVKDMAQGLASVVVFFGSGDLIGPLLSGWLYDTTGNYRVSFFIMGGFLFSAGPMMLLIPLLQRTDLKYRALKSVEDHRVDEDFPEKV